MGLRQILLPKFSVGILSSAAENGMPPLLLIYYGHQQCQMVSEELEADKMVGWLGAFSTDLKRRSLCGTSRHDFCSTSFERLESSGTHFVQTHMLTSTWYVRTTSAREL